MNGDKKMTTKVSFLFTSPGAIDDFTEKIIFYLLQDHDGIPVQINGKKFVYREK